MTEQQGWSWQGKGSGNHDNYDNGNGDDYSKGGVTAGLRVMMPTETFVATMTATTVAGQNDRVEYQF